VRVFSGHSRSSSNERLEPRSEGRVQPSEITTATAQVAVEHKEAKRQVSVLISSVGCNSIDLNHGGFVGARGLQGVACEGSKDEDAAASLLDY